MKILARLLLFFALPAFAQSGSVVFTWTGNGNPSMVPCSTTVKVSCLTTYTLTDVTTPSSPIVVAPGIPIATLTYTLATLPPVGIHSYNLVTNALDQSGNTVVSLPSNTKVTIPSITINPPLGFSATTVIVTPPASN